MKKTVEIDFSDNRLISVALDMIEDHNYIGALKMLNKNAGLTGNDEDSYMLYAEIFDDMGLCEMCINNWFKFMDVIDYCDYTDCYEGLAVNYMNIGNEHFSAYYYNKLLMETEDIDDEAREEIVKDFLSAEENPLKFAWPPEIADVSDVLSEGLQLMKQAKYAEAREMFSGVKEGNPDWVTARNYIAMCAVIEDKPDEAERECLSLLEKAPDNVQALTTLAAVLTENGRKDEALEITKKLLSLDVKSSDDIYKIATVCCENGLHAEAYSLFSKMDGDYTYEKSILFFRAISAFNCGKTEESFDIFDKLLTIYPEAVTARYFYNLARTSKEDGGSEKLDYFYRLPQDLRQSSLKMLAVYMSLPVKQALAVTEDMDISSLVRWCFDECEYSAAGDLQMLAAHAAIRAGMDDFVRDILLNAFLPDKFKIDVLVAVTERNRDDEFGIVICNVYKRVSLHKLCLGRKKKKYFIWAYAQLVAHFAIIENDYSIRFAEACEKMYARLEAEERLDAADDEDALTAAVFLESGVRDAGVTDKNLCRFFNITKERLEKVRGVK